MDVTEPIRLATGSHVAGTGRGCAMNVISWEQGENPISDYPAGVHPMLAAIVHMVNDTLITMAGWPLRHLCPSAENCKGRQRTNGLTEYTHQGAWGHSFVLTDGEIGLALLKLAHMTVNTDETRGGWYSQMLISSNVYAGARLEEDQRRIRLWLHEQGEKIKAAWDGEDAEATVRALILAELTKITDHLEQTILQLQGSVAPEPEAGEIDAALRKMYEIQTHAAHAHSWSAPSTTMFAAGGIVPAYSWKGNAHLVELETAVTATTEALTKLSISINGMDAYFDGSLLQPSHGTVV